MYSSVVVYTQDSLSQLSNLMLFCALMNSCVHCNMNYGYDLIKWIQSLLHISSLWVSVDRKVANLLTANYARKYEVNSTPLYKVDIAHRSSQ